jgi:hypothetical protein
MGRQVIWSEERAQRYAVWAGMSSLVMHVETGNCMDSAVLRQHGF